MPLVSCILIWRQEGAPCSRLTTNASKRRLLTRLADLGLLESVLEIHAFFGDRAEGGNGYDLVWNENVQWSELPGVLARL